MSAIELRGVAKQYPPREPGLLPQDLLRGVDLVVRRGEFVAVEGQSGSGKSTLLHVLGGLDREFAGEALVLGCDLRAVTDAELAALRHTQIGFVFQSFNLLPALTAREALDRVGLADKARARPAALSGGERQRVAIARALVARPPLLLADEPTGNLDARTGEGVIDLFRQLHREGMTLLIVTHEARVSHAATRVLVLREGRLHADGAEAVETE